MDVFGIFLITYRPLGLVTQETFSLDGVSFFPHYDGIKCARLIHRFYNKYN